MPALPTSATDAATALGEALRRRRRELKLSQTALAEKMSWMGYEKANRQLVSNVERGLSGGRNGAMANPELRTLLALCEALEARLIIDVAHPVGFRIEFVDRTDQPQD